MFAEVLANFFETNRKWSEFELRVEAAEFVVASRFSVQAVALGGVEFELTTYVQSHRLTYRHCDVFDREVSLRSW